jgi:3D (Asp-Asp-Asp) domain-containing protein
MRKAALLLALLCGSVLADTGQPVRPTVFFVEATAFAQKSRPTAAGTAVHDGVVAADPRVLPLGSRIRITGTTAYDGTYLVTDTGPAIKGRHIDIFMPSAAAARQFGVQRVRVQILRRGKGPADARRKEEALYLPSFRYHTGNSML